MVKTPRRLDGAPWGTVCAGTGIPSVSPLLTLRSCPEHGDLLQHRTRHASPGRGTVHPLAMGSFGKRTVARQGIPPPGCSRGAARAGRSWAFHQFAPIDGFA